MSDFLHKEWLDVTEAGNQFFSYNTRLGDSAPGLGLLPEIEKLWLKFRTQPNLGCGEDNLSKNAHSSQQLMLKVKALQEVMMCKWNLPWKSRCELVKQSFAEVFWGLMCCSAGSVCAQVLCEGRKVMEVIMCTLKWCCSAREQSWAHCQAPWKLCPGALDHFCSDLHSLSHCPLVETQCYS